MVKQQPTLPVRFSVRRPHAGQRGVSLVEILVAIVILVVGILTIIRLFPGGFLVVRSGENSTIADRLGQAAIEGVKQDGGALPDGVFITDIDKNTGLPILKNNQQTFVADARPDDLVGRDAAGYDAADSPNPFTRDINRARYIKNETITVPAGRIVNNVSLDPIHVLRFGPIVLDATALPMRKDMPPGAFEANLSVTGTPWKAQAGDARASEPAGSQAIDNPDDILTPGQTAYLVDTAAKKIAVPTASYQQAFIFVFQAFANPGDTLPQTYVVHLLLPAATSGWFSLDVYKSPQDTLPTGTWIFGSTTLSREFRCLNMPTSAAYTFSADPYEYALANSNFPNSNVNVGALAFNPRAAGQQGGRAPLQARISYTTLDWHIIHEDREIPTSGSHTIRLALNNLKKLGDPPSASGGDVYHGFIPQKIPADTANDADFIVLDLNTGKVRTAPLGTASIGNVDDTDTGNDGDVNVSYNGGRVTFPADSTDPSKNFGGAHVRVFYASALEWGVAVQKAPSFYQQRLTPITDKNALPGPLRVAEYFIAGNRVYFPLCDAGKTVEFEGIRYTNITGADAEANDVAQAVGDIERNSVNDNNLTNIPGKYASVDVADLRLPKYQSGLRFTSIRGASVRSTIIWKERGDWKTRNVDTLLTRAE